MPQPGPGNVKLAAVIAEAGMSHAEVARAFVRVARESNAREYTSVGRSHVSHWVAGSKPSGRAPLLLCEALSRKLGRNVTLDEVGLPTGLLSSRDILGWRVDTLATLTELGRADVDAERRRVLNAAAYSLAALTLPTDRWWADMADRGHARGASGGRAVGRGDVDAVRDMVSLFSRVDQRRGGGHARTAVVQYLTSDVANFLRGHYSDDALRRDMFSAASELSYLVGWMAFDNGEHNLAQHYFNLAVKLAAEAANPAMAGHVLRAMAHQAIDLGHYRQALDLASASVEGMRYQAAAPRERALVGVVYARALAVNGNTRDSAHTLLRAENDLAAAANGDDEPERVFFFGEASLAHETACALRDTGDLVGATSQFQRSVRTRNASTFARTHAVTLGYLGSVQARQGEIEEACATWSRALDAMDGVRSGRTRQVAAEMRATLAPYKNRSIRVVRDLEARAQSYLATFA